jgi:hypothetical protein
MQRTFSIFFGVCLMALGLLVMGANLGLPMLGVDFHWWEAWRFWPMVILGLGALLTGLPFLFPRHRAMGILFIPALPILANGGILFFASLFDAWHAWAWLWPLEILSVAAGFLAAALYTQVSWLAIPAILIGANGLVLAFCNTTGLWNWWTVLWTIEPLSLGLCILLIWTKARSTALLVLGLLFCGFAMVAAAGMSTILFSTYRLFSLVWPLSLILVGGFVLLLGMGKHASQPAQPTTPNNGA